VNSRLISCTCIIAELLGAPTLHFVPGEDPNSGMPQFPDRRRAAVAGLIVTILLIVGGLLLVHVLGSTGKLQDCVMSGRTNCTPIDSPATGG
jgi:hypothetical protein